jgi:sulfur carrier protein ThiS
LKVIVHLHSILQLETPEGMVNRLEVELAPDSSMESLLHQLQIQLSPEHMLLVRNGRVVEAGQVLQDGDQINLMPAISGGMQ